jgi:hypothetical protein
VRGYLYERNGDMTTSRKTLEHYHELGFKQRQQLECRFVAAGGLLLAGSDSTGDGHILPGFGDQREIELFVDSGFTPVEAIKMPLSMGPLVSARPIISIPSPLAKTLTSWWSRGIRAATSTILRMLSRSSAMASASIPQDCWNP